MYGEVIKAYEKFKNDISKKEVRNTYKKHILKIVKQRLNEGIYAFDIRNMLKEATCPTQFLNDDLEELYKEGKIENKFGKIYYVLPGLLEEIEKNPGRNKEIVLYRLEGKTLQEIASKYDITRERVRQIIEKYI